MSLHRFHRVTIDEHIFEGHVGEGSVFLTYYDPNQRRSTAWAYIGSCTSIREITDDYTKKTGYAVVKYGNQPQINLCTLSLKGVQQLAKEFGIPQTLFTEQDPSHSFFTSPAFISLRQWAHKHPKLATKYASGNPYLMNWLEYMQANPIIEIAAYTVQ